LDPLDPDVIFIESRLGWWFRFDLHFDRDIGLLLLAFRDCCWLLCSWADLRRWLWDGFRKYLLYKSWLRLFVKDTVAQNRAE
jgi:hypothetical protein